MSHEFRARALEALEHEEHEDALADLAREELGRGTSVDKLIERLRTLRPSLDEQQEDAVLDVMDRLVGWCGPQARIEPPENQG